MSKEEEVTVSNVIEFLCIFLLGGAAIAACLIKDADAHTTFITCMVFCILVKIHK